MQKTLPIHFAPLQGYTEVFYRNAHAACFGGIDTYYTPFVRLEKGGFRHRDVRGIEPGNNQVPHLIPQLIAPSFDKADKILSLFIEKGYKEVDINMGCPFPMLAKRHNGSGILPYPADYGISANKFFYQNEVGLGRSERMSETGSDYQ